MKGTASRKLALDVLVKVEVDKAYANLALSAAFEKKSLSERDRAFATFLVHGVLRHRDELDGAIMELSSQPLAKMSPLLRNLLRIAIYQLKYATDIPESAVVNTAIEIGKTAGHAGIGKFASGLLRSYLRKHPQPAENRQAQADHSQSADSALPQQESEDAGALARRFSVPQWLVDRWLRTRGHEETVQLLAYSQTVPELIVRTCESGITPEALESLFRSQGIKARRGKLVPGCLIIEDRGKYKGPLEKLPGYTDGLFIIQDEAAAFASLVVDPRSGEVVVDLCAAPGGKTIHLAEMMENKGRVLAVDTHASRLELLRKTRQRVGLTNIETFAADGTTFDAGVPVDRVLIDAPCTGTGVINRRTDLRFKREEPDINSLVQLQRQLLENAARMLKPGGVLVYSTCSIEPEENEGNLFWFLDQHKEFKTMPLTSYVPAQFLTDDNKTQFDQGWIQLLPTRHGLSGFFVAKLEKTG